MSGVAQAIGFRTRARASGTATALVLQRQGALIALVLLIVFASLRYDGFLSEQNLTSVLASNATIGLISLGMAFVIMTGGIDLSVGSTLALGSVVAAHASDAGIIGGLAAGVGAGAGVGLVNGLVITKLGIQPFIVTLATLLGARGLALTLADNRSVDVSFESGFTTLGETKLLGLAYPAWILLAAFAIGIVVLRYTRFGRHVLAIGGNEEAARLMGLRTDRIKLAVYVLSGALAGLAGVLLASQNYAGQPTAATGYELSAIAAVVVGGTLLTGGMGSIATTFVGCILLALVFNVLNFESGEGTINLTVYWQTVIRGGFLLVVVILQAGLLQRARQEE
jgi:galactofuranose transport system permease protein